MILRDFKLCVQNPFFQAIILETHLLGAHLFNDLIVLALCP